MFCLLAASERLAIDPGSYAITPNKSLGIEDFDQYLKLMFTVTAVSATKDSSSAVVALSYVKRGSLHFDSPMYSAEYSEDGLVTFADGSHIGFEETTDFSAVEIAVGPGEGCGELKPVKGNNKLDRTFLYFLLK